MTKYITFGNWNKNYLYIIGIVVSVNIYSLIAGFGYHTYLIAFFIVPDHTGHTYIHKLFYYLLILIFSFIYFLYDMRRNKNDSRKRKSSNNSYDSLIGINGNVCCNNINKGNFSNIPNYFVYLIIFLFIIIEYMEHIINQFFSFADYWMLELIIMAYLNYKMLNIQIFKHQKLSLYLIIIPVILKSITIVFLYCDKKNYFEKGVINYKYNNEKYNLLKPLYVAHWWLFPVTQILNLIKLVLYAYVIINIKKFMDFKYVSINKLLILYGLFGILFTLIISLITNFISCGKKNDYIYDIYDYICKVVDKNNNRFIENYRTYFTGEFWKDLLYTLIGAIGYNIYILLFFSLIKHFNPVYKSFTSPMVFLLLKLILISQLNNDEPIKYLNASFFIDLSCDFFAIIPFLIFLEIVELNFCDLNKNLRKYIVIRSTIDAREFNINEDISSNSSRDSNVNELYER